MAAVVLLTLVALTAALENITLETEGQLITSNLPVGTSKQLISDVFSRQISSFFVPQCHSKQDNFTFETHTAEETGSSVGDVIMNENVEMVISNRDNSSSFNVYCTFTNYPMSAPIPGGCNEEFNFEQDPNIHIWYDGFRLWVQFQYASIGDALCDNETTWSRLSYSVYVLELVDDGDTSEKTFSTQLSKFISPADIKSRGTELFNHTRADSTKPALMVTSYPDQGVFVAIVVYDNVTGHESAYVSRISYGCDVNKLTPAHPCQVQWYYYLLTTVLALAGLFLTFMAHRFFTCELAVMGFLSGLLCGTIGLLIAKVPIAVELGGSAAIAVVAGVLWTLVWQAAGIASLSLTLTAANGAFLFSSVVMYTPLVNVSIFKNTWEIWIIYATVILLTYLVLLIRSKKANIILCAFLGSYMVSAAISVYCNASLHHIIVEPIRRAAVSDYYDSVFSSPFGVADGLLAGLWVILTVVGSAVQLYTERGKPDFPMSPRKRRQAKRVHAQLEETERLLNPPRSTTANYGSSLVD